MMWTPPADVRETTQLGRYLDWLRETRGIDHAGYGELWRWSVDDLEGFWGSIWDFFEVRAHTPYDRVLGSRFGVAAIDAVTEGDFGKMVALRGTEIVRVPLD